MKKHKFILIVATVIVVTVVLVSYFYVSSLDCSEQSQRGQRDNSRLQSQ